MSNNNYPPSMIPRQKRERTERLLAVLAFGLLLAAWWFGYYRADEDAAVNLPRVMPQASAFERDGDLWKGIRTAADGQKDIIGYVGVADAPGYGGPLKMMVAVDTQGNVIGAMVIDHRETPTFFHHVVESGYLGQFLGKSYGAPLSPGDDIDGVTGASFTSGAIATGIRNESREIAKTKLGLPIPAVSHPIRFGAPEITLILLYGVGYLAHRPKFPGKKWIRWGTLLAGMIVLGFWLNRPLTVGNITSLLAGYWPDWHNNLYWFLLVGGIFFVITVDGKNPYCSWFCPFGAAQECLHFIGQGNWFPPRAWSAHLKWMQRGLAFLAIFLGLALRQPGATSYEVFGTLFSFTGTNLQWVLLAIVLLASLALYRPWCNYVCPIDPIVELVARMRRWTQELWKQFLRARTPKPLLPK